MATIRQLKKVINGIIDELNYDIELFVGLNLDRNHYESQQLYEEVYLTRVKYLEKVNQKGLTKADYNKIMDDFFHEVDELNKKLVKIINKQ